MQLLTLSTHLQYIGVGDLCSVYSASFCTTAGIGSNPHLRTLKWISGWRWMDNFRQPATTKEACSHPQKFLIEIHQFSFTTRQQARTNRDKFSKVLETTHTASTFKKKETLHYTQWIKTGATTSDFVFWIIHTSLVAPNIFPQHRFFFQFPFNMFRETPTEDKSLSKSYTLNLQ